MTLKLATSELTKIEIEQEISELFAYYQRPLSPYILGIWQEFIAGHLSPEEIHQGIGQAIAREKELPTPEQLVELVKGSGYFSLIALNQSLLEKAKREGT
jgi:hypothetical protein